MSSSIIIIIIAAAVLLLLIGVVVYIRVSNRKKSKKLQENLDKYKKESTVTDNSVSLAPNKSGENISEDELFGGDFGKTNKEDESELKVDEDDLLSDFDEDDDLPKMPKRPSYRQVQEQREERDKEFEEFLDDHAFSRKVFDKSILDKIKDLPPDIKSIIMGNVFDKFDDDK